MEVSGRGASTRPDTKHSQGSDEYSTGNQCEQCQEDELSVPADGYCADCGHYLCGSCIKLHRKLKMSKDHTMLTGEDMPHQKPQASGMEQCSKHPGKLVELYCPSDDTFGCYLCFTICHKSCQNVRSISNLSEDVESSEELMFVQTTSQQHDMTVELYRQLIAQCHVVNNTCYDKSLDEYQSFRVEIEALLDCLGQAVETEAGALKETNKKHLDSVSKRVTSLHEEMVSLRADIELKRKLKQYDTLFIALKTNMKSIKGKVQKLQQLKKDIHVQSFVFHEHSPIKESIQQMVKTGIKKVSTEDITYAEKINVKSPDDKKDCNIAGTANISSTRMVVSDQSNQCLKLIDVDKNTVITKRSLTSRPYGVTVIPKSRVAVTLPYLHLLKFFKTDTGLEPCGHIAVDGQCISIESSDNRLVVGYSQPPKIQIIHVSGQVLKSFTKDSGNPVFGVPRYLSLSPGLLSIIISDRENNTVTSMSTEGTIEWVYRDKDLQCPLGVTTESDGRLYICSCNTNSLHVVSGTGVRQKIIQEHQPLGPRNVCFSKDQNVLYVSGVNPDPALCNSIRRLSLR